MSIRGRVWRFGAHINTDLIFPNRYFKPRYTKGEMASHVMSGADPSFPEKVGKGDIIVGGRNFGCGSSREEAAACMREAEVGALVAPSFGRIFMRNCINLGLPVAVCPGIDDHVTEGDELELDFESERLRNVTTGYEAYIPPMAPELLELLRAGSLVEYTRRALAAREVPAGAKPEDLSRPSELPKS
jgi:3-isopropylmalate/(R)-2-methylmalate dehydratase small subunit